MRELLEDLAVQSLDPREAARRSLRQPSRARFYREATVGPLENGVFPVLLDGRAVRTPARRPLASPSVALTSRLAAEWDAQSERIDPASMPLTRLANSIIDGVADGPQPVADEIAHYLASDLLFYRAEGPAGLVAAQSAHWDPLIAWAQEALGARFMLAEGVMFVAQPERAIAAVRAAIPQDGSLQDIWRLGAVHVVTTLCGSALLALALLRGRLSADEVWAAAHVDEDWNTAQWGRDDLALERRAFRRREMQAAATVVELVR
jgi:chaperone required for assembly of F1-ATPase